jgi:hypothetical protein
VWVDPIVKNKLRDSAAHGNTSLSSAAYTFLKRGMQQDFDLAYGAMLTPAIENTITKHMKWRDSLLIRAVYYSAQNRGLLTNLLHLLLAEEQKTLASIVSESQEQAAKAVRSPSTPIAALIQEFAKQRDREKAIGGDGV